MSCGLVELSCIVRCIIPWWGAGENVIDRVGSRVARSVRTALVRRRLAAAGSLCAVPVGVAPCRDTHARPVEQKSFETTGLGQRSTTGQPAARSRPDSDTRQRTAGHAGTKYASCCTTRAWNVCAHHRSTHRVSLTRAHQPGRGAGSGACNPSRCPGKGRAPLELHEASPVGPVGLGSRRAAAMAACQSRLAACHASSPSASNVL